MSKAHPNALNILLFEDNAADATLVEEYLDLSNLDYKLTVSKRLSEGLYLLNEHSYDLILLDLSLPDTKGIETLKTVKNYSAKEIVIVLTGTQDEQLSLDALKAGAQDYLYKDTLSEEVLRRSIRYSIERVNMLRKAEAHMQEAKHRETLLRRIFDANTDAMLILTPDYGIKFLNPAACTLLEADISTLIGETFPFEIDADTATELEIPTSEGSTKLVELAAVDLIWEGQSARLVILRDVTRRRRAEINLKREKERLAITLDSIADAVITIDNDGRIERINETAIQLIGTTREAAIGKKLNDTLKLQHPKTGKLITNPTDALLNHEKYQLTPELGLQLCTNDSEPVYVRAEMRCILDDDEGHYGCVVILHDITNQKLAEEELFKSEKLQSISLLAGGIAHDFNNILTAILGNISVVRMDIAEDHKHAEKLLSAEKAALQATSLTQQLLTFSKGGAPMLEPTTITQLVDDCRQFILRGSNVLSEIETPDEVWSVDADKGQIAQVINNLLINADQAMPAGGVIKIKLSNRTLGANEIPTLLPGNYVSISIQDGGTGITPENLTRIFDPYFTTKKDGNGLGLASSYSIIKSHHGIMVADSEVEIGSTFTVYLPQSKQKQTEHDASLSQASSTDSSEPIQQGHGRILVMDDMEAMMMVAGEIIKMLGYEVDFSTNGQEAIDAYKAAKEAGTPFDAVVFDLTVPGGMGGEEAAEILLKYDPNLLAIASSGYSTSNVMSDYQNSPFTAVVPKPYRIKEMSDALHSVLHKKD